MIEFLKLVVTPVVLVRDEDGAVTGEQTGQPTALYTREQIEEFMDGLEQQILIENATTKEEEHVEQDE